MSVKNDFSFLREIESKKDHDHVGCGVLTFPNGDVYTGQWCGDFFHGQGEMQFQNGSSYSGRWFQSEFCGHGVFKSGTNGCIYEGGFINSAFNGHGMMMYPNGDIYEGEWRNDKKWGYGCMSYADGRKETSGLWVCGEFQSPYALPRKCPPKAAKVLGVEHMPPEGEPSVEEVAQNYAQADEAWEQFELENMRPRARTMKYYLCSDSSSKVDYSDTQSSLGVIDSKEVEMASTSFPSNDSLENSPKNAEDRHNKETSFALMSRRRCAEDKGGCISPVTSCKSLGDLNPRTMRGTVGVNGIKWA